MFFPALAVADELRDRGVPVIWVGTKKGIEYKVVPGSRVFAGHHQCAGFAQKRLATVFARAPDYFGRAV